MNPHLVNKPLLNADNIVAISGGCDSVCLAHVMIKRYGIKRLYHFNHGTTQADDMQAAVMRFAADYGLSLDLRRTNSRLTREADFRDARMQYYFENKQNIVTAHTLDDAVESYCMNFYRGHLDYFPIPLVTQLTNGSRIIHPFLLTSKQTIREYIKRNKLEKYVVEDLTNHDPTTSRRSWTRNVLLPLLNEQKMNLTTVVHNIILRKDKEIYATKN